MCKTITALSDKLSIITVIRVSHRDLTEFELIVALPCEPRETEEDEPLTPMLVSRGSMFLGEELDADWGFACTPSSPMRYRTEGPLQFSVAKKLEEDSIAFLKSVYEKNSRAPSASGEPRVTVEDYNVEGEIVSFRKDLYRNGICGVDILIRDVEDFESRDYAVFGEIIHEDYNWGEPRDEETGCYMQHESYDSEALADESIRKALNILEHIRKGKKL